MGIRAYIIRRVLLMIPTLIGVTLLIFAIMQLFSPSQRASVFITSERAAQETGEIMEKYHLNAPVYVQYVYWVGALLQGNLGWSQTSHMPTLEALVQAAPTTFELVMLCIPATILVGIKLGVLSAVHRDKPIDHATRLLAIIGWSLPTFWLGLILLAVFFGGLGWFPPGRLDLATEEFVRSAAFIRYTGLNTIDGLLNGSPDVTLQAIEHLVLPTITLTTVMVAMIIRVMRSSMLEALGKGYITAARAKGLTQKEVTNKHAQRNALIPVITLSGMLTASLITGVVLTETVFNTKGLGYVAVRAATQLDVPMILAFALLVGIIYVVANLIVDVTYAYIDPRIMLG